MDKLKGNETGKNRKAFVSMVLACLLALQTMLVPSAANITTEDTDAVQEWDSYEEFTLLDRNTAAEEQFVLFSETLLEKLYDANTFTGSTYGDQLLTLEELTEAERADAYAVYEAMRDGITPQTETLEIALPKGISMKTASASLSNEQKAEIGVYVQRVCQTAADAYVRDCPEDFWVNLGGTGWEYSVHSVGLNGSYTVEVKTIRMTIGILDQCRPVNTYAEQFETAAKSVKVDETDRYSTVKSIHDWLIEKNEYTLSGKYAYSAYGGLVDGKSVCEGYAEGFKVMCDKYDVPCVLVTGAGINSTGNPENHMWNYVQMEDGKWYAVDVTWDDTGSDAAKYDYFLVGGKTKAEHFDGKAFADTHIADGDFNGAGIVSFGYPKLEEQRYIYAGETASTDTPASGAPAVTDAPASNAPAVTDTPASGDPAVSETPEPNDPTASGTPAPVVYGDLSGDGQVGADDALLVLKAVVKLVTLGQTEELVADVGGDGEVDASDALLILKKVVKLIDVFPVEKQ